MCESFAVDTFLFSNVSGVNKSVTELNADLEKSTNGLINGKGNLTPLIPINKQMKLFFPGSLFNITYLILPLNLTK